MDFQAMYYEVDRIDGDYAYLRRTDEVQDELNLWQGPFCQMQSGRAAG